MSDLWRASGIGRGLAEVSGASLNLDARLLSQEVAPRPQLLISTQSALPACTNARSDAECAATIPGHAAKPTVRAKHSPSWEASWRLEHRQRLERSAGARVFFLAENTPWLVRRRKVPRQCWQDAMRWLNRRN